MNLGLEKAAQVSDLFIINLAGKELCRFVVWYCQGEHPLGTLCDSQNRSSQSRGSKQGGLRCGDSLVTSIDLKSWIHAASPAAAAGTSHPGAHRSQAELNAS